jgi:hypothetical protein
MNYRPTTLGDALFKAATSLSGTNHPLARVVRSNIRLNAPAFSVALRDQFPVKEKKNV